MKRYFAMPALLAAGLALIAAPAAAAPLRGVLPGVNPALMFPNMDMSPDKKIPLNIISSDPFTNTDSQHKTEVEPDTFGYGSTIVSVFQQGRFNTGGGASDIGWATTTNGGKTWKSSFFKGITKYENSNNPYQRVSDPSVGYSAKYGLWVAIGLPINNGSGLQPVLMSSPDGITWSAPVLVAKNNGDFIDKTWIACDNFSASPHYGNCYIEDDDATAGDQEYMTTTTDGGKTFSKPYAVPGVSGLGGQPLAQPNGTVVVPHVNVSTGSISDFMSTDGGKTWGNETTISAIQFNTQAGGIRSSVLPSAEIDGAGNIYVAWPDCRFRSGCTSDDIVYATSGNGTTWSAVQRVPIDPVTSGADHFIPGIAVDVNTSGSSAHVALTYYYYTNGACSTCKLYAGYISSADGGSTWNKPVKLAGPIQLPWLALTDQGYMVGDYISTSYINGKAFGVIANAKKPNGTLLDEYMATNKAGRADLGVLHGPLNSWRDRPIAHRAYRVPSYPLL